jgi:hypothetical protein
MWQLPCTICPLESLPKLLWEEVSDLGHLMIFAEYVRRVQTLSICTSAGGCSLLANGCFCGMPSPSTVSELLETGSFSSNANYISALSKDQFTAPGKIHKVGKFIQMAGDPQPSESKDVRNTM